MSAPNHLELVLFAENKEVGRFVVPRGLVATADYVPRRPLDGFRISEICRVVAGGNGRRTFVVVSCLDHVILAKELEYTGSNLFQPLYLLARQITFVFFPFDVFAAAARQGDAQANILAAEPVRWVSGCSVGRCRLLPWNTARLAVMVVPKQLLATWGMRPTDGG